MNTFFKPVEGLAGTEQLNKCLSGEKTAMISGCIDTQKVHMAQTLSKDYRYNVIVTYDEAKAREMCEDAAFFNRILCIIRQRILYSIALTCMETRLSQKDSDVSIRL